VVENLDEIIAMIRASESSTHAQEALQAKFSLTEIQAKDVLALPLRSLTRFDRQKILDEHEEVLKKIVEFESILEDHLRIYDIIVSELQEIKKKYGDPRRTEITAESFDWSEKTEEDFITEEDIVITLTNNGYIKSMSAETYKAQHRGGKGIKAMDIAKDDYLKEMIVCSTHDTLLFLTVKGMVFTKRGFQIPMSKQRVTKGVNIANVLKLERDDEIRTIIPVSQFDSENYLIIATKRGIIKKTPLNDYEKVRSTGIIAQRLRENDVIIGAKITDGSRGIILATLKGKAIRFPEEQIRVVKRSSIGVLGIRLNEGDYVVDLALVDPNKTLLTVSENGYGKRSEFKHYRITKRNGKGVINMKTTERNGNVIAVRSVTEGDYLLMVADDGKLIQIQIESIRVIGRATAGVTLMRTGEGVKISSIAILSSTNSD
jgi:DNA gyrase subunit A